MNALESLAETAFAAGWRTAWQAAVLIALVLCVTRLLRGRLSSRWTYALWCLVALRLALPASPQFSHAALDWDRATHRPAATMPTGAGALAASGFVAPRAAREGGAAASEAVVSGAALSGAIPSAHVEIAQLVDALEVVTR